MPIVTSTYKPSYLFRNSHFSTIYPNLFRKVTAVNQQRERLELDDGDFMDIDWSYGLNTTTSKRVAVVIHGLEGSAQRQYMMGLIKHLNNNFWDVAAVNLRNCSGEANRLYQSYNAGVSDDLHSIIKYVIDKEYPTIAICGFSLGGNITLKYIGERAIPTQVKFAVAISVPCDLYNSLSEINKSNNSIYRKRFIKSLKKNLHEKQKLFPDKISTSDINSCTSIIDIDDVYTSTAHGFSDAMDYYAQCSSKQFLKKIRIPTLIINAKNDSFLGDSCYPVEEAKVNSHLFLEIPDFGGHVGFYDANNIYYSEWRIIDFLEKNGCNIS